MTVSELLGVISKEDYVRIVRKGHEDQVLYKGHPHRIGSHRACSMEVVTVYSFGFEEISIVAK